MANTHSRAGPTVSGRPFSGRWSRKQARCDDRHERGDWQDSRFLAVPDVKKVQIQDLTPIGYAAAFIGSSALFVVAARAILRTAMSGRGLAGSLALLFLLRATLLFTTPIGSDDVYRYLWDGKVQAAALNPYAHAPSSPVLQRLHSDTLPRLVNHPDLKTPYFPLAQWVFWLAYSMSGEAVWGVKLLILLAEALTVAGTILLLRHLGQPLERSLLYAAAPLALFQFAFDGHIDAIGFPFLVFGLLLHLRGRIITGPALLGLSMSVKPVAAVVVLVLLVRERGWRRRLAVALAPLVVLVAQFIPYAGDARVFEGFFTFARDWMFNGSVFSLVHAIVTNNQHARIICAAMCVPVILAIAVRSKDVPTASVYAVLALLLFSPVVHPWYVGWLAVLLPFAPRMSGLVLVSAVSLTSLTVVTYQTTGVWTDYPLVRLAEYAPVLALLARELRNGDTHLFEVSNS